MKIYVKILFILFVSCGESNGSSDSFVLDSSKPVEVGIESFTLNESSPDLIGVYMVNHQPVSGIQFQLEPSGFFRVDSVFGGRIADNEYQLHHNSNGKILAFSMSGKTIPESKSSDKKRNLLFLIQGELVKPLKGSVSISPIVASSDAKKLDCISVPFELVGK